MSIFFEYVESIKYQLVSHLIKKVSGDKEMKLAEALAERAAVRKRLDILASRMERNAKVYEDEKPVEDPEELLAELGALTTRYDELIFIINSTNSKTVASNGETLVRLLARRDTMKIKIDLLHRMLRSTDKEPYFHRGKDQPKEVVTINVSSLRKKADELSGVIRDTDALIQEANWNTEI